MICISARSCSWVHPSSTARAERLGHTKASNARTCCRDEDRGSAPIDARASRSDGPSAAPSPSKGGGLEVSGLRHMGSCGRRLPSLKILSVGFWPPNWGPEGRLGVLLSTVDLNIPDIAVSSGDRNNQGKRPEVTSYAAIVRAIYNIYFI